MIRTASARSEVPAVGWAVAGAQRPRAAPVKGRILPSPSQITRAYPLEFSVYSRQPALWSLRPAQIDDPTRMSRQRAFISAIERAELRNSLKSQRAACGSAAKRLYWERSHRHSPTRTYTPMSTSDSTPRPTEHGLERVLGPWMATALVVGTVIGSGVFKKPAAVAQSVPNFGWAMTAWVVIGLLVLCGGLALAEVTILFPRAGGNYVFLREAFGRVTGFLWGWVDFFCV